MVSVRHFVCHSIPTLDAPLRSVLVFQICASAPDVSGESRWRLLASLLIASAGNVGLPSLPQLLLLLLGP